MIIPVTQAFIWLELQTIIKFTDQFWCLFTNSVTHKIIGFTVTLQYQSCLVWLSCLQLNKQLLVICCSFCRHYKHSLNLWLKLPVNTYQTLLYKKVQQSWQTSTLAMHLPLVHLVSMPVIFCLHPSSSIAILVFTYFLQASVNSMCENCGCKPVNTVHWFDASCSIIPVNNSITLISPIQSL